jgi:hypothetical protein
MKIAVIGSGISGLTAALLLSQEHVVTLFEKESELGGHAHTAVVHVGKKNIPVDTGFMVFNPPLYPNLTSLFKYLKVKTVPTSMRFSVSMHDGGFEWNSDVLAGIFVDKRNYFRPSFWLFLLGILRFNRIAREELARGIVPEETLEHFLTRHKVSRDVRLKYLYPMAGAIWSTPVTGTKHSPALAILTFMDNHHLLSAKVSDGFLWRTLRGGSREYVAKIEERLKAAGAFVRTGTPVRSVERRENAVVVETAAKTEIFDYAVLATHADITLGLLRDPSEDEQNLLSKFQYETNEVFLHTDPHSMPHRRRAWAAWNYLGQSRGADGLERVSLTYHMNELQHLVSAEEIFVTLNPHAPISGKYVRGRYVYKHPIYTPTAIRAQEQLGDLQNKRHTLFCGSYFGYGFHEDGAASGVAAAAYLGAAAPWRKKATRPKIKS